jgi:hypothetical protein
VSHIDLSGGLFSHVDPKTLKRLGNDRTTVVFALVGLVAVRVELMVLADSYNHGGNPVIPQEFTARAFPFWRAAEPERWKNSLSHDRGKVAQELVSGPPSHPRV